MDEHKIIKYPISTEKSIRMMEAENKLMFVVDKKSTKAQIKQAIEKMFATKIKKLNTRVGPDAKKVAYVTFTDEKPAIDIATDLGLM